MFSQRVPQSTTMHGINYIILDYMGRWTYEESFLLGRTLQVKVVAKTACWAEEWSATSFLNGSVCCCCSASSAACWSASAESTNLLPVQTRSAQRAGFLYPFAQCPSLRKRYLSACI